MGTKQGGSKAHQTLKQRLGPEKYSEHMASIGARGGAAKVLKGGLLNPANRGKSAQELHTKVQASARPQKDN